MLFTPALRERLSQMYRTACQRGYEYISIDQLMLELLAFKDVQEVLREHGVDPDRLGGLLLHYISELTPRIPLARQDCYPRLTADLRHLMTCAFRLYALKNRNRVDARHLLPIVLVFRRAMSAMTMERMGVGRLKGKDSQCLQAQMEELALEAGADALSLESADSETEEFRQISALESDDPDGSGRYDNDDGWISGESSDWRGADQDSQARGNGAEDGLDDAAAQDDAPAHLKDQQHRSDTIGFHAGVHRERGNKKAILPQFQTPATTQAGELLTTLSPESFPGSAGRQIVGREQEILAVGRILLRKEKNNVLLIGESGVGKTCLIRHLICQSPDGQQSLSPVMRQFRWHQLNTAQLLASMRQRNGLEREFGRLRGGDELLPVLVIDNFGELIGQGTHNRGSEDVARLLLNAIDQPGLRVIGACNYKEFHGLLEHHPPLIRRFQTVDIDEPSRQQTLRVLEQLRPEYELYHQVRYQDEVLGHILACAERFDLNRYFPEKAVDIMDEAGSYARLHNRGGAPVDIDTEVVETVARQRARIDTGRGFSLNPVRDLKERLSTQIFNQDRAIDELVSTLKISFSDLRDNARMRGCFLFVGPTGVGKTELTRQLAQALNMPLHRYDMSEFAERHSTSRLIGAPPGYVGFEGGGQLVSDVRKAPHSVILLDELEKAHGDVLNLLLQMMDYGTLTSSSGIKTRFHHCILVATTNAGAAEASRNRPGFIEHDSAPEYKQQLHKTFSPEFINRFDSIVCFNSLRQSDLTPMVHKLVAQLNQSLADKKMRLECEPAFVDWLCHKAFDRKLGARPLSRLFQETVKLPIADYIDSVSEPVEGAIVARIKQGKARFVWPAPPSATNKSPAGTRKSKRVAPARKPAGAQSAPARKRAGATSRRRAQSGAGGGSDSAQ